VARAHTRKSLTTSRVDRAPVDGQLRCPVSRRAPVQRGWLNCGQVTLPAGRPDETTPQRLACHRPGDNQEPLAHSWQRLAVEFPFDQQRVDFVTWCEVAAARSSFRWL
jgi:hypothetical protein